MAEINNEIRAILAISQNEAFTGAIRTLTLANGQPITVTIPPHSQNGQVLQIFGPSSERLLITLAIAQQSQPPANTYPAYRASSPSLTPPPPGTSLPGSYEDYQFSEFVPGAQIPYPAPTFPNSQSYPAYPSTTMPSFPRQPFPGQIAPTLPLVSETQKKRKRPAFLYNLLIFLALLIIVGSALAYLFGSYVPTQERAQATTIAHTAATSNVRSQITATARINNTATAVTNATATVVAPYIDAYNTATSGTPSLTDDLSVPSVNNWDTDANCTFTNNSYHIIENDTGYLRNCFAQATNFSNFAYQVQMTILKGNAGGLIFRANADSGKMYAFLVDSAGNYIIYYYPSYNKDALMLDSGSSQSFTQGYNKPNLLTIIAKGTTINFYTDKQYLTSIKDSSAAAGQIGLLANFRNSATEVSYMQAKVWSIS